MRCSTPGHRPLGSCSAVTVTRLSWEVVRSGEAAGQGADEAAERIGALLRTDR